MEVLSTVEGLESLEPTQVNARLLPLKDWNAGEDSYYADMLEELNTGHTAPFIYSGWENLAVPMGEKMIDYICGNATLDEVIACFDESQHLVTEDITPYYTTVTETISTEDCAKLVGNDVYGNGNPFPYVLVTKGGMELDDDTTYTIPVCGATEEVAEAAGGFTDSGVFGLDAAREYLSQFETLRAEDIVWE